MRKLLLLSAFVFVVLLREMSIPFLPFVAYCNARKETFKFYRGHVIV